MRVSTLRQPSLSHVLNIHAERFEVQDDAVFTLLACGIPVEKLNHKEGHNALQNSLPTNRRMSKGIEKW